MGNYNKKAVQSQAMVIRLTFKQEDLIKKSRTKLNKFQEPSKSNNPSVDLSIQA